MNDFEVSCERNLKLWRIEKTVKERKGTSKEKMNLEMLRMMKEF